MAIDNPLVNRINEKRKEIAKIEGEKKEEMLDYYIQEFVEKHLKKALKEGDLKECEKEIEGFLKKLENGNFPAHKKPGKPHRTLKTQLALKDSHAIDEEEMVVKELIFDYLEEDVIQYVESKDKEIVQDVETTLSNGLPRSGSNGRVLVPLTGHDMEYYQDNHQMTDGTPKPEQGKWKYVKASALREHAEEYTFAADALQLLGKMADDLGLPREEHGITQKYIDLVGERAEKLRKAEKLMDEEPKHERDATGKLYLEVAKDIREKELNG